MIDTTAKAVQAGIDAAEGITAWYQNPWVWLIGVGTFILLFAAIVRGNSKNN